jgi:hypothetical protein
MNPAVLEPKSDNEITLCFKLDKAGFVVDMVEEEELKGTGKQLMGQTGNFGRKQ